MSNFKDKKEIELKGLKKVLFAIICCYAEIKKPTQSNTARIDTNSK